MAVYQADRYRCLAVLVSSYSQNFNSNLQICRGPVGVSLLAIGCEAGAKGMKGSDLIASKLTPTAIASWQAMNESSDTPPSRASALLRSV
jgi:hypothetical protein